MRSETKSLRLPGDLADAAAIRAKELGYANWNAYIKALIRYDLLIQGEHTCTLPISNSRPEEQDAFDADLLERAKSGIGKRGQHLEKVILRIAGDLAPEVKKRLPKNLLKGEQP